jgi:hypothetical protein
MASDDPLFPPERGETAAQARHTPIVVTDDMLAFPSEREARPAGARPPAQLRKIPAPVAQAAPPPPMPSPPAAPERRRGSRSHWVMIATLCAVVASASLIGHYFAAAPTPPSGVIGRSSTPASALPPPASAPTSIPPVVSPPPAAPSAPRPVAPPPAASQPATPPPAAAAETRQPEARGASDRPAQTDSKAPAGRSSAPPVVTPPPPSPTAPTTAGTGATPANAPAGTGSTIAGREATAVVPPPKEPAVADREAIDRVLAEFRTGQADTQTIEFKTCRTTVYGATAVASCAGTVRVVPPDGDGQPVVEPREWTFALNKSGGAWAIGSIKSK